MFKRVQIVLLIARKIYLLLESDTDGDAPEKRLSEFLGGPGKRYSEFLGGPGKRLSEFLGGPGKRYSEFLGGPGKRYSEFLGGPGKRYSEFLGKRYSEFLGKRSPMQYSSSDYLKEVNTCSSVCLVCGLFWNVQVTFFITLHSIQKQ